jgi:predicted RNase H-like HicB family nuclease
VLTEDKKVIIDALKSGQLVFAVALGEIIEDLKGEVITLQKEKKYEVTVKSKKYSVILHPYTEDGGYCIECPTITGCISRGETVEETLEMIKDIIRKHLEKAKELKKAV